MCWIPFPKNTPTKGAKRTNMTIVLRRAHQPTQKSLEHWAEAIDKSADAHAPTLTTSGLMLMGKLSVVIDELWSIMINTVMVVDDWCLHIGYCWWVMLTNVGYCWWLMLTNIDHCWLKDILEFLRSVISDLGHLDMAMSTPVEHQRREAGAIVAGGSAGLSRAQMVRLVGVSLPRVSPTSFHAPKRTECPFLRMFIDSWLGWRPGRNTWARHNWGCTPGCLTPTPSSLQLVIIDSKPSPSRVSTASYAIPFVGRRGDPKRNSFVVHKQWRLMMGKWWSMMIHYKLMINDGRSWPNIIEDG